MNLTYARFMSICLSCLSKLLTDRKWQTALLRPGWPGWPGLANGPVRAVWPFGPAPAYYEFILSIFPLTGLKSRQDLNFRFCIQSSDQKTDVVFFISFKVQVF